jgi:hypothetical protein
MSKGISSDIIRKFYGNFREIYRNFKEILGNFRDVSGILKSNFRELKKL